jgi:hypothetical protein
MPSPPRHPLLATSRNNKRESALVGSITQDIDDPSAIATLSQAALLVENKRENSSSPVLFVVPVVQSFMQQQDRIAEEIRKQIQSSCCEYVLAHACRFDDLTFPKNRKRSQPKTPISSPSFSVRLHRSILSRPIELWKLSLPLAGTAATQSPISRSPTM